jgi:hypothetical protein
VASANRGAVLGPAVFVLSLESWASGGEEEEGYADHLLFADGTNVFAAEDCVVVLQNYHRSLTA